LLLCSFTLSALCSLLSLALHQDRSASSLWAKQSVHEAMPLLNPYVQVVVMKEVVVMGRPDEAAAYFKAD